MISKEALELKKFTDDEFQPYDKFASSTVEDPEEDDRQYAHITFGSGKLEGYFVKD